MRLLSILILSSFLTHSQDSITISGLLQKENSNNPIENAILIIEGTSENYTSNNKGEFKLSTLLKGNYTLKISAPYFVTKRLPLLIEDSNLDLGIILLKKDITVEKIDNLITLTESDLSVDDETVSLSAGLLQATRDVFLNRAAFDFGQAFFRVRGYDSSNGEVLINGIRMNKLFDGRPQWNNWGGLNDIIRNQEFTNGLAPSDYTFGGVLGNTNIDTRPSNLRPGIRLSSSASNRTYAGRLMTTVTSPINSDGLAYTFSASRRWAKEGFIEGTLYDAYSFFGALEYQFNKTNSIALTTIFARNRRGRSTAITEEVFELVGNQYNPFWGEQNGAIRNSRERIISEPIVMFNHYYDTKGIRITSGVSYQFGTNARSRLGFFNAPNPDPTNYRYLPSFYINNPIGADFTNAGLAREGFLQNRQINWANLYQANSNGKAAYVFHDDIVKDTQLSISSTANVKLNQNFKLDFGFNIQELKSKNFAQIEDLLGAEFHEDIDPFSDTRNNINGEINKKEGDIFSYNYEIEASLFNSFTQLSFEKKNWQGFISGQISNTKYQRNGLFENERFLDNSIGKSEKLNFSNYGLKSGLTYRITGRNWLKLNAGHINKAPFLQNTFINPRESNEIVPDITNETVSTVDLNYFLRLPDLTARVSTFYTRFNNATDINFFFVDSGVGSDFVQEVITDLDTSHKGVELGLEYQISSQVKLSLVANFAEYLYANNPSVTINFDTAGAEEDLINQEGNIDLGVANIEGYKLAQGPQQAVALGIEYRDPKYWWMGATTNYLANNYANISTITRTQSFFFDPETGERFPNATEENVNALLRQSKLDDFYLLNLVGGKSWLIDGKYISVFASINNVFDAIFRTGGFEQSRNGNFGQLQQDSLRDNPSFAPRHWYGFGRTYFLNLAISF